MSRLAAWTLACVAGLAAAAPARAGEAEVLLREQVTPRGAQVLLGDVAFVRGGELSTVRRLVTLPLGHAPRAGTQARLSREAVFRWARSQLGELAAQARWVGADEVLIAAPGPTGPLAEAAPSVLPAGAAPARPANALAEAGPRDGAAADALAPAVARGEWVTLAVSTGGIQLETRAEALQDARTGQPVRVRTQAGGGSIVARVVAPGRVEVTP
jgi:hypothetical protein